jgi:bile acid:Na+ symporter, BASS family
MAVIRKLSQLATRYFAFVVLAAALLSWVRPETFLFLLPHIALLLGIVMFGMGATLVPADFAHILRHPKEIAIGVGAQFLIMPLAGWALAWALRLPPELAAGVILLGACPGGTASNVIAYIARGDVALSVALTSVSTLLAPLLTPMLMLLLAGHWLEVPAGALFFSILQVVIAPVILGFLARRFFSKVVERSLTLLPAISVAAIALIVGAVVGRNVEHLATAGWLVLLVVVLHNGLGLILAWTIGGVLNLGQPQRKTVTLEVGMQNSGLAAALATAHIAPLAALPAALFSVWHNISGPLLANYWLRRERTKAKQPAPVPPRSEDPVS